MSQKTVYNSIKPCETNPPALNRVANPRGNMLPYFKMSRRSAGLRYYFILMLNGFMIPEKGNCWQQADMTLVSDLLVR